MNDAFGTLGAVLAAQNNLQTAQSLCPTDYRINGWLGPLLYRQGQVLNNQSTSDQGVQVLQQGLTHYPSFAAFAQMLIYADKPATDPNFQSALQTLQADFACAPNTTDPACLDTSHAAHNIEGAAVYLGDLFAKAGQKAQALTYYGDAKTGPAYASWAFQSLLDDRIATIDQRIAAGASPDAGDSGVENIWDTTTQCTICHEH